MAQTDLNCACGYRVRVAAVGRRPTFISDIIGVSGRAMLAALMASATRGCSPSAPAADQPAAELAAERARYDANRAERAFHQVQPENRLVARSLEARWKAKLAALAEAEQTLAADLDALSPLASRADLEKLASDLPALWYADHHRRTASGCCAR